MQGQGVRREFRRDGDSHDSSGNGEECSPRYGDLLDASSFLTI